MQLKYIDKEDDWEDVETHYYKNKRPFLHHKEYDKYEARIVKKHNKNNKRALCLACRRADKKYESKRAWQRDNFFNKKAGGTYKKIQKLKQRRTVRQYLYFQNRTSNQFSQKVFLNQEQRRQPIICTLDQEWYPMTTFTIL